jgi:flagellar protein FliS
MFGSSAQGASAYAKVGIETGVIAASPHKLIVMLYDGAIVSLSNALYQIEHNETAAKGKSISKAIAIIENGLRASLDKKVGGEISTSLDSLYEYMSQQLLMANLKNDTDAIKNVVNLLRDLKATWEAISPEQKNQNSGEVPSPNIDQLSPRSNKFMEA